MGFRDWLLRKAAAKEARSAQAYLASIKGGEMGGFSVWIKGAGVALGSGACTALADALANGATFNRAGLEHMGVVALAGALVGLVAYLKKSPLPDRWDGEDRRVPPQ